MASIYGTAHHRDGSKVDGTMRVSTSWNILLFNPLEANFFASF
jgi:hypothetical protein